MAFGFRAVPEDILERINGKPNDYNLMDEFNFLSA